MKSSTAIDVEPACDGDAAALADVYLASRADALPFIRQTHSEEQVQTWIREVLLHRGDTWVARSAGQIVGFMTLVGDDLDQLYLMPGYYRRGIGTRFLLLAKQQSPQQLRLFTFQRNTRARAFYEANGFRIVDLNDGSRNGEGEPDIRYEWTPTSRKTPDAS